MADYSQLKIGDTLYSFSTNNRVYKPSKDGFSSGGPIYREHFRAETIDGETKQSWIVGPSEKKVNKKTLACAHNGDFAAARRYFTLEEKEADIWANDHRYKITRLVEQVRNVEILRKIAEIVGYSEATQ